MPWQESCAMDERIGFINDHLSGWWTMTELCERYEISRKTGYKWLGRYAEFGAAGLMERSRAPLVHGRATPQHLVDAIVGLKGKRKSWGPRKIIATLSAGQPDVDWPSASTAGEILKRAGEVNSRRFRRQGPPRLGELTVPQHANHVWGVDHKGWVRLRDGSRVEPLTMTDGFSRYLISVAATGSTAHDEAKPVFDRAFRDYGLPEVIRSDNGTPFVSTGTTGLTALSAWWIKLGIKHERIDPGHPQQNGRHERFHFTLLEAMRPPEPNRAAQARRFQAFARDYNHERPHEALGQRPPASVYQRSPRKMPNRLPEPDYPSEAAVRKVRSNGEIKWQGDLIHICSALVGEAVAVEENEAGQWQVRFFDVPIGWIDPAKKKLRRLAVAVHGDGEATQGTKT
ncbi:Transposase InsO and inactivated derivatives [Rhizobiales bacterium GAS113]|nr:Transposase InsO and inactivated derivatives [Rhizobiales bacterium GAS113]SDR38359.1 Transposase InsO and inactivated derivatives [Rhizobiales bacterium GAS113]SDR43066.1 Transposase InsO and inactivated derivatives [Rhizobiales bacterium GAS113]SDR62841.1 Transposase InsO and inactivated derivatives [Rhizobiales bacterium GAS113]